MKRQIENNILQILAKCRKMPVNRNDRFWMDALNLLGSISKSKGYPDFLVSWAKEVMNILKDEENINIILTMSEYGCWGIYILSEDNYAFSFNDKKNIYISYRLYKYIKEKNDNTLLAGLLLHEASEFIMRIRAEKKGGLVDLNKNHGEAMRLERELLGNGKLGDTTLQDLFINLTGLEKDRKRVTLDKNDVFVEGCIISGEEIVAEVNSFSYPEESFILQLAPGHKKTLSYMGGHFTAQAGYFSDSFKLDNIDFKDYCSLMKIMDDIYIEESVISGCGPLVDFLNYIRKLDFEKEGDNLLLNILWLFTKTYFKSGDNRIGFLYNIFLLADEYISYFIMKDIVKRKYWDEGRFIKDNLEEILNEVYERKKRDFPVLLHTVKNDKENIKERLINWFSSISDVPRFSNISGLPLDEDIPNNIIKVYKEPVKPSAISSYEKDIYAELSLHKELLLIMQVIRIKAGEGRHYAGFKKGEDTRVYELGMVRVHFWRGINIFNRGETVAIYSCDNRCFGMAEVIDIKDYSIVIFFSDSLTEIPEKGYIRKLEEEELPLTVSLDAIQRIEKNESLLARLLKPEALRYKQPAERISDYFNPMISADKSQADAVKEGVFGDNLILIQGPPGTGKTTVIAETALQFLKIGKRVLLSSQTNNAVDNALVEIMKYKETSMGIARVTSKEEKISDRDIRHIWIKSNRELDGLTGRYGNSIIIGATNVGTHTLGIMKEKEFDVLIMDEAGKSNLIESILPMLLLKGGGRIIIVGDHKQGTPFSYDEDIIKLFIKRETELHKRLRITREKENLLREKLNQSLFERLINSGFKNILLKKNYRSSPEIVELISRLFYNGELIPTKAKEKERKSIIVVDTSKKAGMDLRKETEVIIEGESRGYKNIYEAKLIVDELKELLRYRYISTGIRKRYISGVTILAPYVFQKEEIQKHISLGLGRTLPSTAIDSLLENITTIDSFQGREDDIIIISFTRSNDNPNEVGFLNELNRINVALSRAKRKMVIIGDFDTLMNVKKGTNAAFFRKIFRSIYETGTKG